MNKQEKKNSVKGKRWRLSKKKSRKNSDTEEVIFDLKELLEAKEINLKPRVGLSKSSKLAPSLLDILKKSVALGYFLDFLKKHNQRSLLDFWLEAETYRMISETKYNRSKSGSGSSLSRTSSTNRSPSMTRTSSNCSAIYKDGKKSKTCVNESENLNDALTSNDEIWNCSCSEDGDSIPEFAVIPSKNTFKKTSLQANITKTINLDAMHPSNHEWNDNTDHVIQSSHINNSTDIGTPIKASTLPKVTKSATSIDSFRQRARTRSSIVDAVTIYTKYISLDAEFPIYLPSPERQQIEAIICKDRNAIDPDCFVVAQDYCFEKLTRLHAEFLLTTSMIMYQLKVLDEKQLKLQDILYNESIFFYFMEFLDLKGCNAVLEFYMAAENFEEDIEVKYKNNNYEVEEAVNDAMHMYERYFSMRCEKQLIRDDKLRIVLENNICREDGPQPNCFCIPMAYAWTALSEVYLPQFLSSDMYHSYLDHLRKTSVNNDELQSCSSRSSLSLDDGMPLLVHSDSKLNLFDDKGIDEFWFKPQQKNSSRLTLGHVNEFGVFSSEMEPEPYSTKATDSSVSKLGKAMKSLLRGETQEETEQLAWERARKIVAEIQMETQHS